MEMYSGRANSGTGIQDYHYERLRDTQNGIRLAKIKPGAGSKRIAIDLVEAWLPKPGQRSHEEYDALSYTWGNGERTKIILCNGRRLAITTNLLEVLHRFRDSIQYVTLWIDQICIWQDSLAERNAQVSRMSQIFTSARKVVVWLGDHCDDSQAGMQLADQLRLLCTANRGKADASLLETPGLPRRGDKKWKALAAILHRPWFWRTWIVQEIVLNPVVELVLGGSTLLWSDLEAIVTVLDWPASAHAYHDPTTNAWELPFSRINRIRRKHQQLKSSDLGSEGAKARHWDCDKSDDMELLDLLLMSRDLGATDPRDKVYALLGLSNHELQPDYECSAEHIFTEFAMHTIGEATGLAKLTSHGLRIPSQTKAARQALILLSCSGYHNSSLVLQSWVPDWTADLRSRPLMFDPRFRAGGDELELDWSYETGLQLCGKLLDTIGTAGSVHLEDTTSSHARGAIESWWAEARRIANATVMQSPGSTTRMNAFRGLQRDLGLCRRFSKLDLL
jgi:hypothetical protein